MSVLGVQMKRLFVIFFFLEIQVMEATYHLKSMV